MALSAKEEIWHALVLGIDVESEDPNMKDIVGNITLAQVEWIAAWLASEGFIKNKQFTKPAPV